MLLSVISGHDAGLLPGAQRRRVVARARRRLPGMPALDYDEVII